MSNLKSLLARHVKNSFGWRTKRKIVVFTVDDYGAIRMQSRQARENLEKAGLKVHKSKFDLYDGLEDADDLTALYETLTTVKDRSGRPPVFTAMSIPANPNFEKIKEDRYQKYHYELLTETWRKIPGYEGVRRLWEEGIHSRLLFPQFHGREHLNVKVLMEALQKGDKEAIACFENRSYGAISTKLYPTISYVAAFDFHEFSEHGYLQQVVKQGLAAFEAVFGFRAKHFASPGAREHRCLGEALFEGGIVYLDNDLINKEHQGLGKYKTNVNYTGKENSFGQTFIVRNCVFEPSAFDNVDWVSYCLSQIAIAFLWNKPANISTHRVNFAGHIDPGNRSKGLSLLRSLLQKIVKRWPDVEFMTTVELGDLIKSSK